MTSRRKAKKQGTYTRTARTSVAPRPTGEASRTATTPTTPSAEQTPSAVRIGSKSAPTSPIANQSRRSISYDTALKLQDAKEGGTDLYDIVPTPTINPPRPRSQMAGYDPVSGTLWIRFREQDGVSPVYEYYGVTPQEAEQVRRGPSTGRFINSTLNNHSYARRRDLE